MQQLREKVGLVETLELRASAKSEQVWHEILCLRFLEFPDVLLEKGPMMISDVNYHQLTQVTDKHQSYYDRTAKKVWDNTPAY